MRNRFSHGILIFVSAFALMGCAATHPLISEWSNPAYRSANFRRVVIGGLGGETSVRRNFEDEFVVQLRALGIDALPSYRVVADGDKMDEEKLKLAARQAGADAMLFARAIQVEQKIQYSGGYFPAPWFGFYGPYGGVTWQGLYGAPSVYRYNEYTSETTLYDLAKNDVVWTGTLKTTEPENVRTAIGSYVGAVIRALREKNLLPLRE